MPLELMVYALYALGAAGGLPGLAGTLRVIYRRHDGKEVNFDAVGKLVSLKGYSATEAEHLIDRAREDKVGKPQRAASAPGKNPSMSPRGTSA